MPYMNCLRCGLTIRLRAPFLTLDHCPRCLGRAGVAVPMQIIDAPPPPRTHVPVDPASAPNAGNDTPPPPTRGPVLLAALALGACDG